jgi:hypothetical protein
VSATSFAWSSVNPLPKPLKCFVSLLENIFKSDVFEWHSISRPVECQLKMTDVQGDQAPAKP